MPATGRATLTIGIASAVGPTRLTPTDAKRCLPHGRCLPIRRASPLPTELTGALGPLATPIAGRVRQTGGVTALRLALAQVELHGRRPGRQRRDGAGPHREAAAAGAHLVAFPEMTLTGYPPEDLVLRSSFRQASRAALDELAADLAGAGLGELAVVVGYLDDDGGPRNAPAFLLRRPGRGPLLQAPPAELRRLRRAPLLRARRRVRRGPASRGRHRADGLRGRVAGRRPVHGGRRGAGVGLVVNINGSPYERNKDDVRLPLLQRRAAEAGAPVALRQHGRRPGRAGLRRRLDGGRRRRQRAAAGAAVRRGRLLRRPRARRRAGRPAAAGRRRR